MHIDVFFVSELSLYYFANVQTNFSLQGSIYLNYSWRKTGYSLAYRKSKRRKSNNETKPVSTIERKESFQKVKWWSKKIGWMFCFSFRGEWINNARMQWDTYISDRFQRQYWDGDPEQGKLEAKQCCKYADDRRSAGQTPVCHPRWPSSASQALIIKELKL